MTETEEQLLIEKAKLGDQEALSIFWEELTPSLFGYLINQTQNKTLAEDLLQSTWLKAISALPNFEYRKGKLRSWFFTIAKNECRQHWRDYKNELPIESAEHIPDKNNIREVNNQLDIEKIMQALKPLDQEILRLRYIADLSNKDIAKILKINPIAIRVRLHRILNFIRNINKDTNVK